MPSLLERAARSTAPLALCLANLCGCAPPVPATVAEPTPRAPEPSPPAPPPPIDFVLAPVCGADGEPTALDVQVSLEPWSAEPPVFRIADPENGTPPARERVLGLALSDAAGELPYALSEGPDPADQERRLFVKATRPAAGTLTLRYRARSIATSDKGAPFGLRHDEHGLGGTADGFLVAPSIAAERTLRVRWAVASCQPDLVPLSALGPGPSPPALVAPPDALRQAGFFLARPELVTIDEGKLHVSFAFIGRFAFDTRAAARYAAAVLVAERAAFGDDDPTPFYAFMRVLPELTTRVTGGGNAYGYTSVAGPEAKWDARMRDHLAHELLHHWVGVRLWIRDADGVSGYWLSEGFTVHYSRVVPLRAGLLPPAEFLQQLNRTWTSLHESPHRGASNRAMEDALDRGIGDPVIGRVPYWRGSLYAAELDAAIRRASGGKRSLDLVMRELLHQARTAPRNAAGYAELPESAFRARVEAELGPAGAERFDAVIRRGEPPSPPGHAFGPCFDRREPTPGSVEWFRVEGVPDERCGEPGVAP
ncbi:MAG: hypothetical protein IT373_33915 [Polyangiaceae bacterium]|nr:hypothetical protein [Polyangiaceae bacterium]